MKPTALLVMAGAGVAIALRRRHRHRRSAGRRALAPRRDPLVIDMSDDPGDVLRLVSDGWARLCDDSAALAAMPTAGKGPELEARHVAERLVTSSAQLNAAEAEVVWPALRDEVDGGAETADAADRRGIELRRTLQALDQHRPSDPTWVAVVEATGEAIRAYEVWQRTHVWPAFSRAVPARRRVEMGPELEAARANAPTRPHLATPGDHPRADRLRAAVDRVVDAAVDRS